MHIHVHSYMLIYIHVYVVHVRTYMQVECMVTVLCIDADYYRLVWDHDTCIYMYMYT